VPFKLKGTSFDTQTDVDGYGIPASLINWQHSKIALSMLQ